MISAMHCALQMQALMVWCLAGWLWRVAGAPPCRIWSSLCSSMRLQLAALAMLGSPLPPQTVIRWVSPVSSHPGDSLLRRSGGRMPEQAMPRLRSARFTSCVCLSFSLTDGACVPIKKGAMVCALSFVPDKIVSAAGEARCHHSELCVCHVDPRSHTGRADCCQQVPLVTHLCSRDTLALSMYCYHLLSC